MSHIILDNSYKGDELTQKVATILNLPDIRDWSIVDTVDNLAMVHYKEDADMSVYGRLRGLVVDTEVEAIVAKSFGYTPTVVADSLNEIDGHLVLRDKDDKLHFFKTDNILIKPAFEGVVIRVIWNKGKFYRMTHKKINSAKSRWGSAKTFISMYEEAGGPTAEDLFDTSKPYSNHCYDFLVVDKSLLVGSREQVNKPYIVFLTRQTVDVKRPSEEVAPGRDISTLFNKSIISPPIFNLEQANNYLKFGHYTPGIKIDLSKPIDCPDIRLFSGEALVIYTTSPTGVLEDVIKVYGPAYDWRCELRNNNPNITHQFYTLLDSIAYNNIDTKDKWEYFQRKLIIFPLFKESSIRSIYNSQQNLLSIPIGNKNRNTYKDREDRIYLLWLNYVFSLPVHLHGEALDMLNNFRKDRNDVITWIQKLATTTELETLTNSRVKSIITSAKRIAASVATTDGEILQEIKKIISNFLYKERGHSLYCLVRDMKLAKKEQENSV